MAIKSSYNSHIPAYVHKAVDCAYASALSAYAKVLGNSICDAMVYLSSLSGKHNKLHLYFFDKIMSHKTFSFLLQ